MSTQVTSADTAVEADLKGLDSLPSSHAHSAIPGQRTFPGRLSYPGIPATSFERKAHRALKQRYLDIFTTFSPRLQAKSARLYTHSWHVLALTLRLLRVLDLSDEEVLAIALAAFLHDIGKLVIDDALLNKPHHLTEQEYELLKQHSAYGAHMLGRFPSLERVVPLVYHHHEQWNGGGYPAGLQREAIPLGARIIAIADAFDAMTSGRPYQARRTPLEAFEELQRYAGIQFDPRLVKLFCVSSLTSLTSSRSL